MKNIFFIVCLLIGISNTRANERENLLIKFDESPPSLVVLMKKYVELYTSLPEKIKQSMISLNEVKKFVEANHVILHFLESEQDETKNSFLNYSPVMDYVKNISNKELKTLLTDYRLKVKDLHEKVIKATHPCELHKIMEKMHELQKDKKDYIYNKVLNRYPEYKHYDRDAVIIFGMLLEKKDG